MKKSLIYKNYSARIEFNAEDRIFVGHLTGISDIVSFHGESVSELFDAFESAVDGYIAMSEKLGVKPQKTYSGKLMLRISPEVHAKIARAAEASGKSINAWLTEIIQSA
jgi:predicted HicB family RNase H-like nuclease